MDQKFGAIFLIFFELSTKSENDCSCFLKEDLKKKKEKEEKKSKMS